MTALQYCFSGITGASLRLPVRRSSLWLIFFISAVAIASGAANGLIKLPETYRTPLSDIIYDDNPEWRAVVEDENPWREGKEEAIIKPRIKAQFFPEYDYETVEDPTTRSLFQNEYELDRPRTNLFRYQF